MNQEDILIHKEISQAFHYYRLDFYDSFAFIDTLR